MGYTSDVRMEARRLFVDEEQSVTSISERFGGNPVPQTILNWACKKDADGKTWYDYREERIQRIYVQTSPGELARKVLGQIDRLLSTDGFDTGKADQLSKLSKFLKEFIDKEYHVSMIYEVLEDFLSFCQQHHNALLTRELVDAIRDFKNERRDRLTT